MLTSKIRKVISNSMYLAELLDGVWWRDKKMLKVLQHFWVLQSLLHCLWIFRGPHEINGVVYWNFEQATCVYLIIISTLELFHEKLFEELDLWKINLVVILLLSLTKNWICGKYQHYFGRVALPQIGQASGFFNFL